MQAGNSVQVEAGVACDRFMYVEHALGIPPSYAYRIQCLERYESEVCPTPIRHNVYGDGTFYHSGCYGCHQYHKITLKGFSGAVELLMWNCFFSNTHQSA